MSHDTITRIRISGLRAIDDLTLDLRGLTVLIGDNGTGKSSILEALELLRQAAKPIAYVPDIVVKGHGGLPALLRRGADELRLAVTLERGGPKLVYEFTIGNVRTAPVVLTETVDVFARGEASEPLHALIRRGNKTRVFDARAGKLVEGVAAGEGSEGEDVPIGEQALAVPWLGVKAQPAFQRLTDALGRIELHGAFETRPLWQQRELELRVGPRWPAVIEQCSALARYGVNLPNAYQLLRNLGDDVWTRVLERARLGLGDDFRSFRLPPSGRGAIELEVVLGSAPDQPLPAEALSEGQLSYLAFIALVELNAERSVLGFDEPELHLHPALLARVVWMLEQASERAPVVLATHSDRLLDALSSPAESVVLCTLDEGQAVRLKRPSPARLVEWLESYRGLGSIRAEGYESHVFEEAVSEGKPAS